jgi:hypothetical protein
MAIVAFFLLLASAFDCYLRWGQRKLKVANVVASVCFGAALLISCWPNWAHGRTRIAFNVIPACLTLCGIMVDVTFGAELIMYFRSGSFVALSWVSVDTAAGPNSAILRWCMRGFLVVRCLFIGLAVYGIAFAIWREATWAADRFHRGY